MVALTCGSLNTINGLTKTNEFFGDSFTDSTSGSDFHFLTRQNPFEYKKILTPMRQHVHKQKKVTRSC